VRDRLGYLSRRRVVAIVTPLQSVRLLQWLPLSCLQAQLDCVQVWIQPPTAVGCRGNVPERRIEEYHTIPYSFNNVADIRNLQQYCSIEHYQSGRTKVYDSYIVK